MRASRRYSDNILKDRTESVADYTSAADFFVLFSRIAYGAQSIFRMAKTGGHTLRKLICEPSQLQELYCIDIVYAGFHLSNISALLASVIFFDLINSWQSGYYEKL